MDNFPPLPARQSRSGVGHVVFFHRQAQGECGISALNNALGADIFSPAHLEEAVRQVVDESNACALAVNQAEAACDSPHQHMAEGGWYSEEALAKALVIDDRWFLSRSAFIAREADFSHCGRQVSQVLSFMFLDIGWLCG